jgi:hypothetical protein
MLNDCFDAVHRMIVHAQRTLNPYKSEAIVFGTTARQRRAGETSTIALGGNSIAVSKAVRTLGVTIDSTMTFDHHVANICRTSFCHIRALRRFRKLWTTTEIKSVATAVASSGLDYCNCSEYRVVSLASSQTQIRDVPSRQFSLSFAGYQ